MSAGAVIEIYKEIGRPEEFAATVRARGLPGDARARPHAHGDREPCHDGGLAPVLDRPRPLPRPQRLALEPQHAAREAPPRGDRVPDRERHRGRGRLPRLAPARGRLARGGARGLPRRSRRLLHLRSSARSTASPSCATRSRASRPCSPRPTTGWRWPPSGARSPSSRAPRGADVGARARRRLRLGAGGASASATPGRRRGRRPRGDAAARAEPAAPRRRPHGRGPAQLAHRQPERRPRGRRAASTPSSRSRSTGTSATTAPA